MLTLPYLSCAIIYLICMVGVSDKAFVKSSLLAICLGVQHKKGYRGNSDQSRAYNCISHVVPPQLECRKHLTAARQVAQLQYLDKERVPPRGATIMNL